MALLALGCRAGGCNQHRGVASLGSVGNRAHRRTRTTLVAAVGVRPAVGHIRRSRGNLARHRKGGDVSAISRRRLSVEPCKAVRRSDAAFGGYQRHCCRRQALRRPRHGEIGCHGRSRRESDVLSCDLRAALAGGPVAAAVVRACSRDREARDCRIYRGQHRTGDRPARASWT